MNSHATPFVSVILTTYRRPQYIGATIESLLAQTVADFELLVRDDGDGSDGTGEAVARSSGNDPRVHYHRNVRNLRMPGNLNSGIRAARGKYVAVCHDHDLLTPDFLERLTGLLEKYPSALFAHCGLEIIDQNGTPTGDRFVGDWKELTPGREWLKFMLSRFSSPVSAISVVRRDAHHLFGLYDETYGFVADVEMWLRLSRVGDVAYFASPLIQVRTREEDHLVQSDPIPAIVPVAAMHQRYFDLTKEDHGWRDRVRLALRSDLALMRALAFRWRRGARVQLKAYGPLLRSTAGFVGPILGRLNA